MVIPIVLSYSRHEHEYQSLKTISTGLLRGTPTLDWDFNIHRNRALESSTGITTHFILNSDGGFMRAILTGFIFLLLAGCSSMPSYESGDIRVRTSQLGERTIKIMLYDLERKPVRDASVHITNNRGDFLEELELKRRFTTFQYPMHESSVFIEATDHEGNKGTRQFFRSQLREIRMMKD